MNEEILANVLNEIAEEQKNINQEMQFLTKAIEVTHEEIRKFQGCINDITIEVPKQVFKPFEEIVAQGIKQVKEIVVNQPKEVLQEKRILFYPEGKGENFIKLIFTMLIWAACIVGIVWIIIKVGGPYYTKNSENARYKETFLWMYINTSNKGQEYMLNTFQEMKNDSTREIRVDQIGKYLKKYPK